MEQFAAVNTARSSSTATGMIQVFNPSTEELIGEVIDSDQTAVDEAVARARESFEAGVWHRLPAARRADVLWRAADIIKQRLEELAEIESKDNGMSRQHAGRDDLDTRRYSRTPYEQTEESRRHLGQLRARC